MEPRNIVDEDMQERVSAEASVMNSRMQYYSRLTGSSDRLLVGICFLTFVALSKFQSSGSTVYNPLNQICYFCFLVRLLCALFLTYKVR